MLVVAAKGPLSSLAWLLPVALGAVFGYAAFASAQAKALDLRSRADHPVPGEDRREHAGTGAEVIHITNATRR